MNSREWPEIIRKVGQVTPLLLPQGQVDQTRGASSMIHPPDLYPGSQGHYDVEHERGQLKL